MGVDSSRAYRQRHPDPDPDSDGAGWAERRERR